MNEYLLNTLLYLRDKPFPLLDYSYELEGLHKLPDGAILFRTANRKLLDYHISINDKYYMQYHRGNGITKLGVAIDENAPSFILRTIEGLVSFADLINGAYIRTIFNKLFIMTGVNYLPMKISQVARIDRIIHFIGSGIFPLCLSLLLPIFIYSIVYEKEHKVLEIMKMNGMKMRYYWSVLFCFDFLIYSLTFIIFFIYGGFILGIDVFIYTHPLFQFLLFFGWGFAQISVAFFASAFLSSSQSAISKSLIN